MDNKPVIAVLIVAAGKGERFRQDMPKQYASLLGRPVLRWSLETLSRHPRIDDVYVAIHPDHAAAFAKASEGFAVTDTFNGGKTRQETVRLALEQIAQRGGRKPDYILVHDSARPALSAALVDRLLAPLAHAQAEAVIPALAVVDTVRRISGTDINSEDRSGLVTVQTPQAFDFTTLYHLHRKHANNHVTDDAGLFELEGLAMKLVEGERDNFKITHAADLQEMEHILAQRLGDIRVGNGYDVHRLVPPQNGRKLLIGGVEIPHDMVLDGHSDADVALHAITDALLGAIGAGDIGQHFSPKDDRWKNADSAQFLQHAQSMVLARGGMVGHVDVTVICEAPKIGPHRDAMRARIAALLSLPQSRVSVKATTTEELGFEGRREGIAAQATATVRLPFAAFHPFPAGAAA